MIMQGLRLHGIYGRRIFDTWDRATRLVELVDLAAIVTHRLPMAELDHAVELVGSAECGKVVLTPPDPQ